MARLITLRCSNETYDQIMTALAVRDSGLFPRPRLKDGDEPKAVQTAEILTEWKDGLTMEAVRASHARIEGIAANLRAPRPTVPVEHLEGVYLHEHCAQPEACKPAEAEPAPRRRAKAEAGE